MPELKRMWKRLLMGADEAVNTVVFSGGACNIITADGKKARNTGRDELNAWLDTLDVAFFEPQIHEDTHGRGYDYDIDGPAEQAARKAAKVTLYELAPDTMGGVTCLEVLRDAMSGKTVVIWLSGDKFDAKGRPVFAPNIYVATTEDLAAVHLGQYVENGTKLRQNLLAFTKGLPNVTVVKSLDEVKTTLTALLKT